MSTAGLAQQGWLLCDGSSVAASAYPELSAVLGTAYGSTGSGQFNLPDHRGYFHRGRDAGAGRDPGAAARTPEGSGTATGDTVGSVQGFATMAPAQPFTASVPNLPTDDVRGNYGSLLGRQYADWNGGSVTVTINGGGDHETRPLNRYVSFIVKASSVASGVPVDVPIGAAIAFASMYAQDLFSQWLMCNGNGQSKLGIYSTLYAAIQTAHGGSGDPTFYLPDYRGAFLRGVDSGAGRDPDAATRTAPMSGTAGGNTGDQVGSAQAYATGLPTTAFTVDVPHLPTDDDKVDHIAGRDASRDGDSATLTVSGGGDHESRPVNADVDWYLKFLPAKGTPELSVGSVVALAGSGAVPASTYWLPCDGRQLSITAPQYAELFDVLQFAHGGSKDQGVFYLPDYRGRFLRGTDQGAGRDPDAAGRTASNPGGATGDAVGSVQGGATAVPHTPFTAPMDRLPNDDSDVAATAVGHDLASWNGGSVTVNAPSGGGDAETRPVNINVDYYIKIATSSAAAA